MHRENNQAYFTIMVTGIAEGDSVVSWNSSNPKFVKVSAGGKLTAGKATITVTCGKKKGKIKVAVK